jgi:hypothetical protein
MLKQLLVCSFAAISFSNAQAAILFSDSVLTANLVSNNFQAELGGGVVAQPVVTPGTVVYALELEHATTPPSQTNPLGNDQIWGQALVQSFAFPSTNNITISKNITANWSLTAQAGYQIDSLRFEAGGNYVVGGVSQSAGSPGYVAHQVSLNVGAGVVSSALSTVNAIVNTDFGGDWSNSTPVVMTGGVTSLTSVDLDVLLRANFVTNLYTGRTVITGFDDQNAGGGSESFLGPTLYVTLSQVSPVPEPAEWAMMLAGLGMVGVVSRRRRSLIGARTSGAHNK